MHLIFPNLCTDSLGIEELPLMDVPPLLFPMFLKKLCFKKMTLFLSLKKTPVKLLKIYLFLFGLEGH